MAFYLKTTEISVIEENVVIANNESFSEAYRDTPNVVVDALRVTAPSIDPADITVAADGRIVIHNEEFFKAVTEPAPAALGGPFVKNAGCGGGC
ncbi:MAG: hypothetical protein QM805_14235 [Pseudomonas sp.]